MSETPATQPLGPSAPPLPSGFIPQSQVLAEASPESLGDLMSLQPETEAFRRGLPRMVEALRAMRARFASSEAEKASKPKGVRGAGVKAADLVKTLTPKSSAELDF